MSLSGFAYGPALEATYQATYQAAYDASRLVFKAARSPVVAAAAAAAAETVTSAAGVAYEAAGVAYKVLGQALDATTVVAREVTGRSFEPGLQSQEYSGDGVLAGGDGVLLEATDYHTGYYPGAI